MKNAWKVLAVAAAMMMLMAACKKDTPVNATPDQDPAAPPAQTQEEKKPEETQPKEDPKDEILARAEENKDAILEAVKGVVEVYRSETIPEYYAQYPAKEEYPVLESTEGLVIQKGDDTCDVQAYVNLGGHSQKKMCVSLKYVEAPAEGSSEWMVVSTAFGDIKG